jgi:general secretion pathway protein A
MYKEYFGLKELPFSIAPDPRYLYMSDQHREALAHLVYGINTEGGFVLLTGEVGTGKTTVCRCLLEQIPDNCDIAFILNPKLTAEELLAAICDELGIHYPEGNTSIKVFVDNINAFLLDNHAKGRETVLIIEEAQNLSTDVLEQVRLLTNLETNQRKLLQIIMLGQPELRDMLSRPELRQLAQRITARYHLGPLSKIEVAAYINHRLSVAGARSKLFPDSTIGKVYRLSRGIPRLINLLCDRALLGAYVHGQNQVDKTTLSKAAREVFGKPNSRIYHRKLLRWILVSLVLLGCFAALASTIIAPRPVRNMSRPTIEYPQLSPLNWPADVPIYRSKEMAFQSLLKQWGIIYKPNDGTACQQAQAHGLGCLNARGSLNDLLHLNRPAMLKLYDDQDRQFYATLTAIQGQTATFLVGAEIRTVDVKDIAMWWPGDYTILWRIPPKYQDYIKPGDHGPEVEWLYNKLALIHGHRVQAKKNLVFDDVLLEQVKKFQIKKGLVPDGIVGPLTIIHLNSAAGKGEPLLIKNMIKNK